MSECRKCGREDGHWLGCEETSKPVVDNRVQLITKPDHICEHPLCAQPKKPWSGKGAKPKFCAAGHKKEK